MFQNIAFDMDGTLLNTGETILASLQKLIREEKGEEVPLEELRFVLGIPGKYALPKFGLEPSDEMLRKWDREYLEFQHLASMFDGVEEMLKALKARGATLGVVTSKNKAELEQDLHRYPLARYMDYLVSASDTKEHKPRPEPMRKYLEVSGFPAEETLYLGDTIYDCQCAQGAGVKFALGLWGALNPDEIPADFRLEKPLDLLLL